MKKTLITVITLAGISNIYAQTKCDIYKTVADSLYTRTSLIMDHIHQKYPIDIENPELDTTETLVKDDYILNINYVRSFDKFDIINWFAKFIDEPSLTKTDLVEIPDDGNNIDNRCSWTSSKYCVNFLPKNIDSVDYGDLYPCALQEHRIMNKKLSFSTILYTKDNKKAYLYFIWNFGRGKGGESGWGVALIKTNKKWKINKMKVRTR
ncbi:MAG: hypothetical protein P0Y49_14265 [Candidatus Pedobacter colombiensis]|uniref:Uncharacterized protein n=1 Tax=Candidatus Pedobacter colombiensis TaxID=3121371 RepID=A0AAJ5W4R9_9SPHI|nr:hypothetical protein [Pedobacter sp.]WEK17962.1 MAG: hypothetical protein P0Y49_14265 [Pedobacter sp.]